MGWDSLQSKAKAVCASYTSQEINSLLPTGRQIDTQALLGKHGSSHVNFLWRQTLSQAICPHSSLCSSAFVAELGIGWYGVSTWSVWASCPGCVSSQLLVQLQHSGMKKSIRSGNVLESMEAWLLWKQLLRGCVISTVSIKNPKENIIWASVTKMISASQKPDTS